MGSEKPREARRDQLGGSAPTPPGAVAAATAPGVTLDMGFSNPLSELPETARNLILSAKSIIADEGFDALTLSRLASLSGENKAMTAYYFGNKAGLIAAVLDSVIHDEYLASGTRMKDLGADELTPRLVEEMQDIVASSRDFRVFFELLPRVLRDDVSRQRLIPLYRWYWSVKLEWLGLGDGEGLRDPDLQSLARLLSAVIDGLAIQAAIEPEADLSGACRILQELLHESLPRFVAGHKGTGQGLPAAQNPDQRPRSDP